MTEKKQSTLHFYRDVVVNTFKLYFKHDTSTLGAALSYYMVFSIAPVIIIVISVVGAILGPHAVQGEIQDQLQDFLGRKGAHQIEHIITMAYNPGKNTLTAALATLLLIVGATSVFGQVRKSLNTIWEVKPQKRKPVITYFLNNLFSFGMIICIALLLLVSLVVHAAVTALSDELSATFSSLSVLLIHIFNHTLSLIASTVLFAFVYKYLSDARLRWRSVWEGAFFTAILFSVGKHLISLYIGAKHVSTTYGAIGSAVMLLVWVFYSSQLVFFGAQFTRALATQRGYSLDPTTMAPDLDGQKLKEEQKAER